jgi:hypothetical protein
MSIQEKAFPNPHLTHETGMTIRDYFAAEALPIAYQFWMNDFYHPDRPDTAVRNEDGRDDFADNQQMIAEDCYSMADAMMEARKK